MDGIEKENREKGRMWLCRKQTLHNLSRVRREFVERTGKNE